MKHNRKPQSSQTSERGGSTYEYILQILLIGILAISGGKYFGDNLKKSFEQSTQLAFGGGSVSTMTPSGSNGTLPSICTDPLKPCPSAGGKMKPFVILPPQK